MKSEFNKINEIKQRCEQEMEALKRDNKSLNEKNKTLKKSLTDVENLLKQMHDEKQSLTESLHRNATDIEKKMENERVRDEKIQDLTRSIFEKETEVKTLKDLENAVSNTNRELEQLNKDLLAKINELTINRQRDFQQIRDENAALTVQRNDLATKLTKVEEKLNAETLRLVKEIESSRSIIKDLNSDFVNQSAVIESLNQEKASLVAIVENNKSKVATEAELSVKPTKNFERYESENNKLQEMNRELLVKLENLEKFSERKILDLSQEIENIMENSKHNAAELDELKSAYEQLKYTSGKEKYDDEQHSADGELSSLKSEKNELENRIKKIMEEVFEVSSKNLFLEQKVENFLILEQSHQRLKVSNEKLSRQLDETLVTAMVFDA